jgi:arsenical pump membrane protein
VLVTSILRPWGVPEAAVAVPAAGVAVLAGLVTPGAALAEVADLGPTIGFLAAILLLGYLIDVDGVFTWLGTRLASASAGRPQRLLVLVFATAAAVTAVLSLDATVVLLTPVILATAGRLRLPRAPARLRLRAPGELVLDTPAHLEPDQPSRVLPRPACPSSGSRR